MKNIFVIFISIAIALALVASLPVSLIKSKFASSVSKGVCKTRNINFV